MAKDPAFLFYAADFLVGTITMSNDEVGQYIRLLCLQHQSGHFDALAMQRLCGGNAAASVLGKFERDENGLFFNERLDKEIVRRKDHSEKQKQNASMRWHKSGIAVAMPLETVTETVTESRIEIKAKTEKKEKAQKSKINPDDIEILERLNLGADRNFDTSNNTHLSKIAARRKEHGKEMCIDVVDCMCHKWRGDPKMDEYLRPSTLFAAENFQKYMDFVLDYKRTGKMPKRANSANSLPTAKELFEAAKYASRNKISNL